MKRIVIIGATSGLGKEMALLYAAAGHTVGVTGRRAALLNELQQLYPGQIIPACFDVTDPQSNRLFKQLVQQMGGLDLLIYNAGYGEPSKDFHVETELATTAINVTGFVALAGAAFHYFLDRGSGQIAVTSSVAALRGNSWTPAYSASKAFVSNYAEGLNIKARRLKKNIVITDIRPGFVDTKMAKGNGRFWVSTPQKAALQMVRAIEKKKRVVYITRRWWWVAQVMKRLPFGIYRRIA